MYVLLDVRLVLIAHQFDINLKLPLCFAYASGALA